MPLLLCTLLVACSSKPQQKQQQQPPFAQQPQAISIFPTSPHDAQPETRLLVTLNVYRITVPAKAISHNEGFWKHVNEDKLVDVGTHDRLMANGFRVGVAPQSDYEYFKNILETNPVISQLTRSTSMDATEFELPLKKDVHDQFIFYFDPADGLIGQQYDRCDNSLMIRFESAPKEPGNVLISVTPMLRAQRTELLWTIRNESREISFQHPESKFKMKLSVNVPQDHFLIIAPSVEADESTSLGHKFLRHESPGQEFESLLLISPQPFQIKDKPATNPTNTAVVK
jgi:hypothetical protein